VIQVLAAVFVRSDQGGRELNSGIARLRRDTPADQGVRIGAADRCTEARRTAGELA